MLVVSRLVQNQHIAQRLEATSQCLQRLRLRADGLQPTAGTAMCSAGLSMCMMDDFCV